MYVHTFWGGLKENYLEKLQYLGPRDHCPVSKHLKDNKNLSPNCQLRNSVDYVVVGHQISWRSLDQAAFPVLKYCSKRLVFFAGITQLKIKPHPSMLPPALCEG